MSGPRHIWAAGEGHQDDGTPIYPGSWYPREVRSSDHKRYVLADGDEYRALIERAREALGSYPHSQFGKEGALRDLVEWLENEE